MFNNNKNINSKNILKVGNMKKRQIEEEKGRKRERERGKERKKEREKEKERDREKEIDRQTERERKRKRARERENGGIKRVGTGRMGISNKGSSNSPVKCKFQYT